MKTKLSLLTFLMMIAVCCNAQSDYSLYIDKAMQKLEAGDCEAAQKFYNVYKELTGNSISSVEALILDCKKELKIGDVIDVNGEQYIIAYLMDNKKHGFAIKDMGVHSLVTAETINYLKEQKMPSIDEMRIIYKNNGNIGLTGKYWTCSVTYKGDNSGIVFYKYYYFVDFLSGKEYYSSDGNSYGILLIHRF